MAKQLKWMGFVLVFLIAIYAINSTQQKKYNAKSDLIFDIDRDDVFALEISTASEYLKLKYDGETWSPVDLLAPITKEDLEDRLDVSLPRDSEVSSVPDLNIEIYFDHMKITDPLQPPEKPFE